MTPGLGKRRAAPLVHMCGDSRTRAVLDTRRERGDEARALELVADFVQQMTRLAVGCRGRSVTGGLS